MASLTAVQVHMCRAASRAGGGAELLRALAFESERRPDEGLEAWPTLANGSQSGVDRLPPRVRQDLRRAARVGTALRKSVASRAICIAAEPPVALARALPGGQEHGRCRSSCARRRVMLWGRDFGRGFMGVGELEGRRGGCRLVERWPGHGRTPGAVNQISASPKITTS